jgi:translation initiation factor 2B subunit (eIF-2B alpha/beta/delta family)
MTLAEKLDRIRAASADRIPEEARQVMHRVTEELERSDELKSALREGATAPGFTLPNSEGQSVSLQTALAKGPVMLNFFRGKW